MVLHFRCHKIALLQQAIVAATRDHAATVMTSLKSCSQQQNCVAATRDPRRNATGHRCRNA